MNKLNYAFCTVSILMILSLAAGYKNTLTNATNSENKTQEQPQRRGGGVLPTRLVIPGCKHY